MFLYKKNIKKAFSVIELSIAILIISIIIGIFSGKKYLNKQAALSNLRSISASSPVYDIGENVLWLDISSKSSFENYPLNGDEVSLIKNSAPDPKNDFELVQNSSSAKPEFTTDSFDNLPLIRFDGNDSLISSKEIIGFDIVKPSQFTIFIVQKYYSPNHLAKIISWDDNIGDELIIKATNSSAAIEFIFGGSGVSQSVSNFQNIWNIISIQQSALNIAKIRVNGSLILSSSLIGGSGMLSSNSYLKIGDGLNGDLREIVIFKKELSSDEVVDMERYLSNKWKIDLD